MLDRYSIRIFLAEIEDLEIPFHRPLWISDLLIRREPRTVKRIPVSTMRAVSWTLDCRHEEQSCHLVAHLVTFWLLGKALVFLSPILLDSLMFFSLLCSLDTVSNLAPSTNIKPVPAIKRFHEVIVNRFAATATTSYHLFTF